METNSLKKQAIISLKDFIPKKKDDVINIIETILNCYLKVEEIDKENDKDSCQPANQSKEVKFLIKELQSFIDGINGQYDY